MIGNIPEGNKTGIIGKRMKHLSILDINSADKINSSHYPIITYPASTQFYAKLPSERYRNIIAYYHQVKRPGNSISRTIFPTGNTGIVFVCDRSKPRAFYVGMLTHPREAEYATTGCDYFVALFWPGMSYTFYPVPQTEIADKYVPMNEILPGKSESLTEKIAFAKTFQERVCIFEGFMAAQSKLLKDIPDKLLNIILTMYKNIDSIEKEKCIFHSYSERHIRRLFQNYIGTHPRLFQSIIRHQKILKILNSNPYEDMADLAVKEGYYDQSHFIKDFKRFHLYTPSGFITEFIKTDCKKSGINI